MLGKLGRGSLAKGTGVATFQTNPGSLYICSGVLPDLKGNGIITKLKADFLHQPVGLLFQPDQLLLRQEIKIRNLPLYIARCGDRFPIGTVGPVGPSSPLWGFAQFVIPSAGLQLANCGANRRSNSTARQTPRITESDMIPNRNGLETAGRRMKCGWRGCGAHTGVDQASGFTVSGCALMNAAISRQCAVISLTR